MKIILLQDVKNVGKKDQIVEVSDGFGANFLIPRKLAVMYTSKSVEIRDQQKLDAKLAVEKKRQEAEALAAKLKDITLEFQGQISKDGRMFGTISTKQIVEEMEHVHDIVIDKRKFIDHFAVNALGYTRLKIELDKGVVGIVNVHVSEKK
jgi:large subunit ribosomal protein L9